jgi:hypothetical protein
MTTTDAKRIFGESFIGPAELASMQRPLSFGTIDAPEILFDDAVLTAVRDSHILIFTPRSDADGNKITLNYLRDIFGTDPEEHEPCMYNQDWYLKEDFAAKTTLDGTWHLIRKDVLETVRAKRPEEIEHSLDAGESFPTAVSCAFAFFAYWQVSGGKRLWDNDDRIYVGRYEDSTGINKNGFNIHRHLALRPSYSAAPEIIS